jgi:hypothetical protein
MNEFLIFIICVVILIVNVYFTRWVFRIDEIIEIQKEQTKLLKKISENIHTNRSISVEEQNANIADTSRVLFDPNVCPVCQNPIHKFDKNCSNCGLTVKE